MATSTKKTPTAGVKKVRPARKPRVEINVRPKASAPEWAEGPPIPRAEAKVVKLPLKTWYCHVGTSNESFLRMSQLLASKGVLNNMFMLALFDPDLAEVDVHDRAISEGLKAKVLTEIARNPWYFIREIVRIPVTGGTTQFVLHLGNLFLIWAMHANINSFLVLPRQNFKTVSACCFYMWAYGFGTTNSHMLFFNKEHIDSKNNLKRVKDIFDNFPPWIKDKVLLDPIEDRMNIEFISSGKRGNRIDAKPSAKDPEHADKLGRGATAPSMWFDEIAFTKYIEETYSAAVPAAGQAIESARANNKPYGICITTTPNNLDNPSADFAMRIIQGAVRFEVRFYDLGPMAVRRLVEESETPFLYGEYSWRELGRSEAWYRAQCKALINNSAKIKREIDLSWPNTGEGSVFAEEQMDEMKRHRAPYIAHMPILPREGTMPPGLGIDFIEQPNVEVPYVVGVDVATGENRDYTAFVFHHPSDMRPIGVLRTNAVNGELIRSVAEHVFSSLFPKSVIVVERNNVGLTLIQFLLKHFQERMFYLKNEKTTVRKIVKGREMRAKQVVREYGVTTSAQSREIMIRHLMQIVDDSPEMLALPGLQDEVITLQRKKNGKVEHRAGFHDDVVFAFLVAQYADRHDQPVLRQLLSRVKGGDRGLATRRVAALNVPEGESGYAPPPDLERRVGEHQTELRIEDYIARAKAMENEDEAVKRRRAMMNAVIALNGPGE